MSIAAILLFRGRERQVALAGMGGGRAAGPGGPKLGRAGTGCAHEQICFFKKHSDTTVAVHILAT
jgi:hypothetical protein